jgi:D-alanyl-D-alanine carboxypeptidase/D-alanyl-D-alanine-endopeptidase (penicillin-binding protein 4)
VFVNVLRAMFNTADAATYISFLPVAGESGTLATRFVNTPAQGIVHAKTGTMTGVNSLSGFMLHDAFPPVVFSVLTNAAMQPSSAIRPIIDEIVLLLPSLTPC